MKTAQLGPRLAFAAVAYAFAATMLGTTLPTPLYNLYQAEFGFSQLMVTVIFATYAVGVITALLLFGRLSDQIGRRSVLLPALGLSALSAVAFLMAHGTGLLFVGRVLSGLSAGIFTGTATATLLDLAPAGRGDRATLVSTIVNMGGLGLGPLLAGILAEWAIWPLHLTFWVDLALLLPAAIGVWLIPEPVRARTRSKLRIQALAVPAEIRPTFTRASLAAFAGFAVLGLFTAVSPAFFSKVLGVSSLATIGLVVFSVFAFSTAGQLSLSLGPIPIGRARHRTARLAGGHPHTRTGNQPALRVRITRGFPEAARWASQPYRDRSLVKREIALSAGCYGLMLGMALLALSLAVSSPMLLVLAGLVAGFGQGLSFRAGLTEVNEASPADRRAEVASAFFVVAYVAISIPVVGVGLLAQITTLVTAGITFAAAVGAIAATVVLLLRLDRHR